MLIAVGEDMGVKPLPSLHIVTSGDFYPRADEDHFRLAGWAHDFSLAVLWIVNSLN